MSKDHDPYYHIQVGASTPNNSTSSLVNSPTPSKKDRSSTRKTCTYCHKVSNQFAHSTKW